MLETECIVLILKPVWPVLPEEYPDKLFRKGLPRLQPDLCGLKKEHGPQKSHCYDEHGVNRGLGHERPYITSSAATTTSSSAVTAPKGSSCQQCGDKNIVPTMDWDLSALVAAPRPSHLPQPPPRPPPGRPRPGRPPQSLRRARARTVWANQNHNDEREQRRNPGFSKALGGILNHLGMTRTSTVGEFQMPLWLGLRKWRWMLPAAPDGTFTARAGVPITNICAKSARFGMPGFRPPRIVVTVNVRNMTMTLVQLVVPEWIVVAMNLRKMTMTLVQLVVPEWIVVAVNVRKMAMPLFKITATRIESSTNSTSGMVIFRTFTAKTIQSSTFPIRQARDAPQPGVLCLAPFALRAGRRLAPLVSLEFAGINKRKCRPIMVPRPVPVHVALVVPGGVLPAPVHPQQPVVPQPLQAIHNQQVNMTQGLATRDISTTQELSHDDQRQLLEQLEADADIQDSCYKVYEAEFKKIDALTNLRLMHSLILDRTNWKRWPVERLISKHETVKARNKTYFSSSTWWNVILPQRHVLRLGVCVSAQ
ncbi:hypothetical protein FN846DRAFT_911317 [Sphaerosporella brunnea]|uniref:Uncharacterized protein n=1 Tax=Sphaerosporella brunnea TaxID=1250544 RepID=A0A5J5EK95_9PEZI|nr:hypothetical protein FN846DRAFT_911317 [Sphaerosporella brunnea]